MTDSPELAAEPVQPPPLHHAQPAAGDGDQDVSQDPNVAYCSEVDDDGDA